MVRTPNLVALEKKIYAILRHLPCPCSRSLELFASPASQDRQGKTLENASSPDVGLSVQSDAGDSFFGASDYRVS